MINPRRGDIWLVEFDPQVGEEIQKTRPAIVLSIGAISYLKTRYVTPIRDYKEFHSGIYYFFTLEPDAINKLLKRSSVDCTQAKSVSLQRFIRKTGGKVSGDKVAEIADTIAYLLGA